MTTDTYVCSKLVANVCVEWVKHNNTSFFDMNLSMDDVFKIAMATAMLFATAWLFRELERFIKIR